MPDSVQLRGRVVVGRDLVAEVLSGPPVSGAHSVKEWCVDDDVLNLSDTASFTVSNERGRATGQFPIGARVELEEADPAVAGGRFVRHFTGRVTAVETACDSAGGSVLLVTCMDLGWHLTQCHAEPLVGIKNKTFAQLLAILVDPTWEFGPVVAQNDLNTRLKHGRQVVVQQSGQATIGNVLPYIQVEPGQTPFELVKVYAAREGVLVNVGARGELVFFRPRYDADPLYFFAAHDAGGDTSENNVVGRPTLREAIDGVYSETQCWSTVVIPPALQNSEDPNAAYRHFVYTPPTNPLPFFRRHCFSDSEAINTPLRQMRARWKLQLDAFQATELSLEASGHSQGGAFFVANTMAALALDVVGVSGAWYVQKATRSLTLRDGARTKLLLRLPNLLDPTLHRLTLGGGARRAKKTGAKK